MRKAKAGIILALLVAASLGVGYLSGTSTRATEAVTSVSTSTANSVYESNHEVVDAFAKHMLALSSRNASAIASQYSQDANITWLGRSTVGILGDYNGSQNILLLMRVGFITHGSSFLLGNVTYQLESVSGNSALVNSSFAFIGQKSYFGTGYIGNINGTVSAQDFFTLATNGSWLISQEMWNFTSFNSAP